MDPLGGRYLYEEMGAEIGSDGNVQVRPTARSISVPKGYYAELYTGEKFRGDSVKIYGSQEGRRSQYQECINLYDYEADLLAGTSLLGTFRDNVKSLQVKRLGQGQAQARW